MKLIDVDALIAEITPPEDAPNDGTKLIISVFIEAVKSFPAVDAVEVRHGYRVIKKEDKYGWDSGWYFLYCSECDKQIRKYYLYCPWCGARMDGEEEHNEAD